MPILVHTKYLKLIIKYSHVMYVFVLKLQKVLLENKTRSRDRMRNLHCKYKDEIKSK